ncbi:AMP-binding enzyme [Haladaptatus halobius]|uniref:AMP-binding enzyme n=1 Tax=Haladaptatus halobius TaxID=2884875 RepID=UPI001D0AA052|nr:hypothetical protein [Haladaptatus halobius]
MRGTSVVANPSKSLANELQSYVKGRLAQYEYPRGVAFLDELPKTATGKIRRTDLRETEG